MNNILVVDDMELNREFFALSLESDEYYVITAENGLEALAILEKEHVDLVLLDIDMPVMNGIELLIKIRESRSPVDLPVIMVTASNESDSVVRTFNHGANDYITKPVNIDVALVRIKSQIQLKHLAEQNNEFLSIASHDLKRPLALISDVIKTIRTEPPTGISLNDENEYFFSLIYQTTNHMKHTINSYLDRQSIENGQLRLYRKVMDLKPLLDDLFEQHQETAHNKAIELKLQIETAITALNMDEERMFQVFDNLIGNAIKFTARKGKVVIKIILVNNQVQITVTDSGPGLTNEDLKKLFKKYAKLSAKPTGNEISTGLGLYICKQIVDLHGFEIGAYNNSSGLGSTFWLTLGECKKSTVE